MTFRLVPRGGESAQVQSTTSAHSVQSRSTEPIHPDGAHPEARRHGQQAERSSSPDPADIVAEIDSAMAELRRRAYQNAPRCTGRNTQHVQEWMSVSAAADTFRISKRIVSTWTTQGLIASLKGEGTNCHRLVHIENILSHMERQLYTAKEASLRVSDDDNKEPATDNDDSESDGLEELMQDASPRDTAAHASPIIAP